MPTFFVLNALRHQRNGHTWQAAVRPRASACSTPCGIKGMGTVVALFELVLVLVCSTPCGIKGMGTAGGVSPRSGCRNVLNALRHQRNGHIEPTMAVPALAKCSTPCGIKGMGTRASLPQLRVFQVLNALRHQRNGHSRRRAGPMRAASAQRLAASKEWAHFVRPTYCLSRGVLNALRHQRNGHQPAPQVHDHQGDRVLNALRHQRNGHIGYGLGNLAMSIVLNALRHQRNGHIRHMGDVTAKLKCSTPCGIKGMGTTASFSSRFSWSVCSTPCGIKGMGTEQYRRRYVLEEVCSTPCGIKGMGTRLLDVICQVAVAVLNALRHQRNGHDNRAWAHAHGEGAQRLAASKEWARVSSSDWRSSMADVLNALRHQRNGHGAEEDVSIVRAKCSTPCGIKGMGTRNTSPVVPPWSCAQRLAASKEWAHAGQNVYIHWLSCAQRLAASKEWAPAVGKVLSGKELGEGNSSTSSGRGNRRRWRHRAKPGG